MSFEIMGLAWDLTDISPLAKLIAIEIANGYGPFCEHYDRKMSTLEQFTGADRADILAALDEIEGEWGGLRVQYFVSDGFVRISIPPRKPDAPAPPSPEKPPHWVYVIRANALTKIGISGRVKDRFEGLQAWTPEPLAIVWAGSGPVKIIRKVEHASHADLAAHREFGEWFRISPEIAVQTVQRQMMAHGLALPK
jgi:hypothetical protein